MMGGERIRWGDHGRNFAAGFARGLVEFLNQALEYVFAGFFYGVGFSCAVFLFVTLAAQMLRSPS